MPKIDRSSLADTDMLEIWCFIGENNLSAADRVIEDIEGTLRMLSRNPLAGRQRRELRPHLRSFPVGNHLIFYMPIEDGIYVFRVLHGNRDYTDIF